MNNGNGVGEIQLPLDLNYEVDLWGRVRRTVSAAREEAQASAGDLQTALLSLQAELAVDYFEARSADAEEKLLNDTVKDYEEAYRITTNRFEGGVAPQSDVDQAKTQLEAARVQANDVTLAAGAVRARNRCSSGPAACVVHSAQTFLSRRSHLRFRQGFLRSCWSGGRTSPQPSAALLRRTTASELRALLSIPTVSLNGTVGFEGYFLRESVQPSELPVVDRTNAIADGVRRGATSRCLGAGQCQLRRDGCQL